MKIQYNQTPPLKNEKNKSCLKDVQRTKGKCGEGQTKYEQNGNIN